MSVLDEIPIDETPIVISIDLSTYSNGGKCSTIIKEYLDTCKAAYSVETYDEAIVCLLLEISKQHQVDLLRAAYSTQSIAIDASMSTDITDMNTLEQGTES